MDSLQQLIAVKDSDGETHQYLVRPTAALRFVETKDGALILQQYFENCEFAADGTVLTLHGIWGDVKVVQDGVPAVEAKDAA